MARDREQNERNEMLVDDGIYLPGLNIGPRVPHYYGDYVRRLFLGAAVLMFVFVPLFGFVAPMLLPIQIFGAVILITLGALTNPKKRSILMLDALASAIGIILFEVIALSSYTSGDGLGFFAHEVLAFTFMFSLYFSLKTVRAMEMGLLGKEPMPGEFRKGWEDMGRYTRDVRNN